MIVLDPIPLVAHIHVANDLLIAYPSSKLDQFFTYGAVGGIASVDSTDDRSASPLLSFCC